jgi:predicted CXXCH cytochrome family protein
MTLRILIPAFLLGVYVGSPSNMKAHVNSPSLLEGCGSCHVGHGMAGEPMLSHSEEDFCYQCHGSDENRTKATSQGRLAAGVSLADIEQELRKPFRHPVEEGSGHSPTERLPAVEGATVSHAECVDCHNPHQRTDVGKTQLFKVSGFSLSGQYLENNALEYEVCLKCHSDYLGFDRSEQNLRAEFSLTVRSQHPVTRPASGGNRPSLTASAMRGATMTCSDCHTSDDPNGPRGPHGSNHQFLLSGNYTVDAVSEESPYAYEFCYSCHDRSSILGDESFPMHRDHIVGDPLNNRPGTSCFTCHASHGSREYPHLINFNPKAVTRESKTGLLKYFELGDESGECYLKCHGHDHGPAKY